jgi:hypothetical protein
MLASIAGEAPVLSLKALQDVALGAGGFGGGFAGAVSSVLAVANHQFLIFLALNKLKVLLVWHCILDAQALAHAWARIDLEESVVALGPAEEREEALASSSHIGLATDLPELLHELEALNYIATLGLI